MKFSIIGTGFIFPAHAEAIRTIGGKIRHVVNAMHDEDAWRKMIETTDADCIVILAPNDLHFPMAMAAAEAGKIALVEKPLTIKSSEAEILAAKPNIFTILQLRQHPLFKEMKANVSDRQNYDIEMDISVHRDEKYYKSWKGTKERSGGVLFNLGIHYFELLIHLFGEPTEISTFSLSDKTGTGTIKGKNYFCRWKVSTDEKKDNQRRVFKINGVDYNYSSKDNLSFENLHRHIYKDLLQGTGTTAEEAIKSIRLIEKLYEAAASNSPIKIEKL